MRHTWTTATAGALLAVGSAAAQDAERGAQLYMRLPSAPSCFSCHGPDPAAGRNNILSAANAPLALQKALTNVGAMGFLKPLLSATDVADVAAFLGTVNQIAGPAAPFAAWPLTADFGSLAPGTVSPTQQLRLTNRGSTAVALSAPVVRGAAFGADSRCDTSLAAGASCAVFVRYTAVVESEDTGAVSVTTSATDQPIILALAGRGAAAGGTGVLTWQGAPVEAAMPPTAAGSSASLTLSLVNGGVRSATLSAITVIGPGAPVILASGCAGGVTLAPSSACEVRLTHAPRFAGSNEAMLQVRSDGTNPAALVARGEAFEGAASSPPPSSSDPGAGTTGTWVLTALLAAVVLLWGGSASARRREMP